MNRPFYHVKKRALLAIAGCVWLAAGFNVARLGVLSAVVFGIFGFMFYRMSVRHTNRIRSYPQETRPVWNFFDLKSYLIMAFMMSGGIWLRNSGLAPEVFIAVFYTGLGCALGSAGILFWVNFIKGLVPQGHTE